MKYSPRSQDEAEATRLCGHLEANYERGGLSDDEAAALKRAAIAISVAYLHGLRKEVESADRAVGSDGSLSTEQREYLRQMGIDSDAETP